MALVDSLLRMLIQNSGTTVVLRLGQAPILSRGDQPLRLFFPTFTEALRSQLLGELLTDDRLVRLASGAPVTFRYDPPGLEPFDVVLEGDGCQQARFERVAPAATPAATSAPPAASAPATADAAIAAAPGPRATRSPPPTPSADTAELGPDLVALLRRAAAMGASDLHLAWGERPVVRVHGALRALDGAPEAATLLAQLQGGAWVEEARRGQGVDAAVTLDGQVRVRVHVYTTAEGGAAALRLLRRRAPDLASLGLPVPLERHVAHPHGLVLITGPTGCGKSTTLAALAQHLLDVRGGLLVSLEDPIEIGLVGDGSRSLARQRQIGRDVRDFPTGLRDALREDPDLLLVGELRDAESIGLALTAAETGHLVLASLHSRSAASAVDRLVDACPPAAQAQVRTQLSQSLRAVVAQRLLPAVRGEARVVAAEVLVGTGAVANLIREGRTAQLATAIQSGAADGMLPLERCLRDLVDAGRITLDVALASANDPATLRSLRGAR